MYGHLPNAIEGVYLGQQLECSVPGQGENQVHDVIGGEDNNKQSAKAGVVRE